MAQFSIPQIYELALQQHRAGNLQDAQTLYGQILRLHPKHPGALNHLGMIAHQQGKNDAAIELIHQALAAVPNYPEAHDNLGNALRAKGLFDQAIAAYRRAIALMPKAAATRNNLGLAFLLSGRFDESIDAFSEAISINPNYADAYCNLSNALYSKHQLDDAITAARKSIELNPRHGQAFGILGMELTDAGQTKEALAAFQQSISLLPSNPDSHLNAAILELKLGNFIPGFEQYEWRERCDDYAYMRRKFDRPRWDGSALNGRTLLLHSEQGLGDAIQFSRYLPMIAAMVGNASREKIIFEVQPDLERLFQTFASTCTIVQRGRPLPAFDVECPLLSLPRIFKTTVESIPSAQPYLFADADCVKVWRQKLGQIDTRLNVAVTWAGNPTFPGDHARSMTLELLAPLAGVSSAHFYSVQKGYAEQQLLKPPPGLQLVNLSPDLHDMADTAAALSAIDLVITTDTSIAHLAGALGKPVWVMLAFVADWRWLTDRDDSPWYSSMRLFRQSMRGDWAGVLNRIVDQLEDLARNHLRPPTI